MKKIILSLVAVFAFGALSAQDSEFGFKKGNLFAEGNLKIGSTTDNSSTTEIKNNTFEFTPQAGFFLTDKFALGGGLDISTTKIKENGSQTKKDTSFGFDVFGRYYFLELGQRFKVYGQGGVGLDFGSTQTRSGSDKAKYTEFGIGAGLGINYFVTPKLAINFGLSDVVSFTSKKPKNGDANNEFNVNINEFNNFFGSHTTFGLTYILF